MSTNFLLQTIYQVFGVGNLFLHETQKERIDSFTILSIVIGFISLMIGELGYSLSHLLLEIESYFVMVVLKSVIKNLIGRRRSQVILLRLYSTASSMATALSVACVIRSDFFLQVTEYNLYIACSLSRLEKVEQERGT